MWEAPRALSGVHGVSGDGEYYYAISFDSTESSFLLSDACHFRVINFLLVIFFFISLLDRKMNSNPHYC